MLVAYFLAHEVTSHLLLFTNREDTIMTFESFSPPAPPSAEQKSLQSPTLESHSGPFALDSPLYQNWSNLSSAKSIGSEQQASLILNHFGDTTISRSIGAGAIETMFASGNTEYSMPDDRTVTVEPRKGITVNQGDEYFDRISESMQNALPASGEVENLGGNWQGARTKDGGYRLETPRGEQLEFGRSGNLKRYANGDEFRLSIARNS
jgi:hypothetical protein